MLGYRDLSGFCKLLVTFSLKALFWAFIRIYLLIFSGLLEGKSKMKKVYPSTLNLHRWFRLPAKAPLVGDCWFRFFHGPPVGVLSKHIKKQPWRVLLFQLINIQTPRWWILPHPNFKSSKPPSFRPLKGNQPKTATLRHRQKGSYKSPVAGSG